MGFKFTEELKSSWVANVPEPMAERKPAWSSMKVENVAAWLLVTQEKITRKANSFGVGIPKRMLIVHRGNL